MHEREKNDFPEDQAQNLMLRGLVTCELFSLANYADLMKGIEKICHELQGRHPLLEQRLTECQKFVQKETRSLSHRSFHKFLSFTSDRSMTSRVPNCIFSQTLPDFVSLLSLSLTNVLPSLMAVVSFCEFNTNPSNQLRRYLCQDYKQKRTKIGDSEAGEVWTIQLPYQKREEEARRYIFTVRRSVEEFISEYFRGIFLSEENHTDVPVCPSVELFSLRELPLANEKAIADWINEKDNRVFLSALGCFPYGVYREEGYLLIPPDMEYYMLTRKILGSMSYFTLDKYKNMGFSEAETAFFYAHEDLLRTMSIWFSFYKLINFKTHEIMALRENSRTELSNILGVANLSRLTRLFSREIMEKYGRFSEKRLWFQRFQSELNEESVSMANALLFYGNFKKIKLDLHHEDKEEFWFDSFVEFLRNSTTALQREIELLKEEFDIQLSTAQIQSNILFVSATKRWSITLITLTVILAFFSLLSFIPWKELNWKNVLSQLKLILGL